MLKEHSLELTRKLEARLETAREEALDRENKRYASRQGELSEMIVGRSLARLEREITELKARRSQGLLFSQAEDLDRLDRDIDRKQEELDRRRLHDEELREQLARERDRIVRKLIPKRFKLRGEAQALPVSVEIVLPAEAS